MIDRALVERLIAEVAGYRHGELSDALLKAYRRHAEMSAIAAGDAVSKLIGPTGFRLASRTRQAVAIQSPTQLARTIARMSPAERENFVRTIVSEPT